MNSEAKDFKFWRFQAINSSINKADLSLKLNNLLNRILMLVSQYLQRVKLMVLILTLYLAI
jgi:hypothetical protein